MYAVSRTIHLVRGIDVLLSSLEGYFAIFSQVTYSLENPFSYFPNSFGRGFLRS